MNIDPSLTLIQDRIKELTTQLSASDLHESKRVYLWDIRETWKSQLVKYHIEHPVSDTMTKVYDELIVIALTEVERLARKIMRANDEIGGFCMAMGSATFYETTHDLRSDNSIDDSDERVKEMTDFIDEWDNRLHLTGHSIKLNSCDGPLITTW